MVRAAAGVLSPAGVRNGVVASQRPVAVRVTGLRRDDGLEEEAARRRSHGFEETSRKVHRIADNCLIVWSSFWCLYLAVRSFGSWDVSVRNSSATRWSIAGATFLLGLEVGVLVITGLLAFLIPRMVMTWTTTIVFEYIFGKGLEEQQVLIRDGRKIARELFVWILTSVLRVAVVGAVVVFGLLAISETLHYRTRLVLHGPEGS